MKEYLFSLVFASILASLFVLLCPAGRGMEKSFRTVVSLLLLLAVFSPLVRALGDLESFDFGDMSEILGAAEEEHSSDRLVESLERYGAEYVNAEIRADVCSAFEIADENCRAVASFEMREGAICLRRISIILSGKAIWRDPHEIEDYVEEKYGCRCVTAVE